MFKTAFKKKETVVFKMKKSNPVNFNEYPFRVIEFDRRSSFQTERVARDRISFASNIDEEDIYDDFMNDNNGYNAFPEDNEEFATGSIWPDYSNDDDGEYVSVHHEDESEPYLQQFDRIDFNGTDWNSYDFNRIVF